MQHFRGGMNRQQAKGRKAGMLFSVVGINYGDGGRNEHSWNLGTILM